MTRRPVPELDPEDAKIVTVREAAARQVLEAAGVRREIVVTADSVSMLAEAVASGKPVALFDIEEDDFAMRAEEEKPKLAPIRWRGR